MQWRAAGGRCGWRLRRLRGAVVDEARSVVGDGRWGDGMHSAQMSRSGDRPVSASDRDRASAWRRAVAFSATLGPSVPNLAV